MSKLEINYNWFGEYKLLKKLDITRFKISDLQYPEYLYIFTNDDNTIRYTIIDDNFGMPSPGNTSDTSHAIKLRRKCVDILSNLEENGYISSVL